ncbi:uncharacterized protein LOC109286261 isoform X2 [Alligator mississippiensis]|uniref:uncharacterized protein LOC109286261 isoform X2 n=1 Tax=Alligator mississippiensis TaxID=8496 RepID=UPI0028772D51|nr:uncharacterized protein LOC109286261 isoform X2 [Alligator mississippiensis]
MVPQSPSHKLFTQLRENLETEGRTTTKWAGPKWKKGKMINVLFRAFVNTTRDIENLNSQLLTLGKVAAENAAAQQSPTPLPQYGAGEKLSFFTESEKKGRASEKDMEDRVVGGPQLPHSLRECNGADPTAPTPEHQLPPPYDKEKKPSKLIYPSLPTENPPPPMKSSPTSMKTAFPIIVTKYTTDPQGVTHATSTYRTRNRTEMQDIFQLSKFKSGETLAIWLGRLVVKFGSELLDMEEASFLILKLHGVEDTPPTAAQS